MKKAVKLVGALVALMTATGILGCALALGLIFGVGQPRPYVQTPERIAA